MAYAQGLASMAPARLPAPTNGLLSVSKPFYGPDAPPPDEPIGEDPMGDEVEVDAVKKLIGQFNNEIDLADFGRQPKERAWIKVEKYLAGKDVHPHPAGYTESTFFYRRLPRITQIGKAKLFKHVCPLQGRPWDVKRSPRRDENASPDEDKRINNLKAEVEDIQEAMEGENLLDDMCEYMSNLGSCVFYGPVQISQPRLRWQDGAEHIEEEDVLKPMWEIYDPKEVYPDPNAKKSQQLEYVHFHHVMSAHQIRSLQEDPTFIKEELAELLKTLGPSGNWAQNLKRWEIVPYPTNVSNAALSGFCVWKRIGLLTAEALEALGEKFEKIDGLNKDQVKTMTDSMWEIWFCDKFILKISRRKFQPNKLPVYFVPFRRDPASIFGVGAGESALECVEMLTNITRSIEDALNDTSGFQVMIDAGKIQNKDLKVQGRKTWIYRSNGKSNETPGRGVDFFTVPSNLEQLLAAFKTFESMIPICTGFLEMANGQDMGSGVRTDSMMNQLWDSLEEFIKDVVGNVDRYWWKPFLRDCVEWVQTYYPNPEKYKVSADLQVHGVRGALRREIVGRKAKDFFKDIHQFGMPDWIDEIEFIKAIAEGMGLEQERALLTPQQFVEKQAQKAQQAQILKAAGMAPENEQKDKERAHSSTRDAMLEVFKSAMTQGKDGLMPPVVIPAAEKLFKLTGELDPKVTAALSIWTKMLVQQYEQANVASQQEAAVLEAPAKADNPQELSPGSRNPQEAATAIAAGSGPKPPANPPPAMPTTQQVV